MYMCNYNIACDRGASNGNKVGERPIKKLANQLCKTISVPDHITHHITAPLRNKHSFSCKREYRTPTKRYTVQVLHYSLDEKLVRTRPQHTSSQREGGDSKNKHLEKQKSSLTTAHRWDKITRGWYLLQHKRNVLLVLNALEWVEVNDEMKWNVWKQLKSTHPRVVGSARLKTSLSTLCASCHRLRPLSVVSD